MPTANEMHQVAKHLTASRKDKIAGLAWYCFRNHSTEYVHWLHKDRQDSEGNDRWQVMQRIGAQLIDK